MTNFDRSVLPPLIVTSTANDPSTLPADDPEERASASEQHIAHGMNLFGANLWRSLGAQSGNLAIAPASVALATAMAEAGARGETLAEMRRVLFSSLAPVAQAQAVGALGARWNRHTEGLLLRTANRLYGHERYRFEPSFADLSAEAFGAPMERVNFSRGDSARARINAWVAERTSDRIVDLLPPGSVDDDTRLVLVNAMYLRAQWETPFDETLTRDVSFFVGGAAPTPVPTMHRTATLRHGRGPDYAVVELPYCGDLVMNVILPDARDGVAAVEARVIGPGLTRMFEAMWPTELALSLPRFRVDPGGSIALRSALEALGMRLAFDRHRADFSGMASPSVNPDGLALSESFHKVFVEVNELGTEAAAATAFALMLGASSTPPPPPPPFNVDHPFLFVIRERVSGAVLFLGRVNDPRSRA